MYVTKAQKLEIAKLIGELAQLASFQDIDTAHLIGQSLCRSLGIRPDDVAELVELQNL